MGAFFKSGAISVEEGLLEKTITGLAFPSAPTAVTVSLRLPNTDADVISAFVMGSPTQDGFTVGFSSLTGEGYILDWTASAGSEIPSQDGATNAVTYTDLFDVVRRFLGYSENLTEAQKAEVDDCVQAGVRQFYFPPAAEGIDISYRWSFLRFGGALSLTKGISRYHLPDGFGVLDGVMTYAQDADSRLPSVGRVAEEVVRSRLAHFPASGAPRMCAIVYRDTFDTHGQLKDIVFYPTPDKDFTLEYMAEADTGKLDAEKKPYPLGGVMFSEVIRESCLAKAEQLSNDELGEHTKLFYSHLAAAIQRDRNNSATDYGQMSFSQDPGGDGFYARRNLVHGLRILYNGREL